MCYLPSEYKVSFSPIKEHGAKGREPRLVKLRASAEKYLIGLIRRVQQSKTECLSFVKETEKNMFLPRKECENGFMQSKNPHPSCGCHLRL